MEITAKDLKELFAEFFESTERANLPDDVKMSIVTNLQKLHAMLEHTIGITYIKLEDTPSEELRVANSEN